MKSKKLIFIVTLFLIVTTMKANAQVAGKTYEAEVNYVCKKMSGGGCVILTYCVLNFKQETVEVYYYTKAQHAHQRKEKQNTTRML